MIDNMKLCEEWLSKKQKEVKSSTYHKYNTIITNYVLYFLAEHPIEFLNQEIINTYLHQLLNKGLSNSLVLTIKQVMKSLYEYAEKYYHIAHIDFGHMTIKNEKKREQILDLFQQKLLYNYCIKNINMTSLSILLALFAGLRISEICAIQYKDVDLRKGTIFIHQIVRRDYIDKSHGLNKIEELKEWPAKREIAIADFLVAYLKDYMVGQDHEYFLLTHNHIIPGMRTLQKNLNDIGHLLEFEINFNMLRQTYKENCINCGMDFKIILELLGTTHLMISLEKDDISNIEMKHQQIHKLNHIME